jgi:lipid II:glycine glycyltransferase (peptidoglycan interpeptide bridge formation enzyme)
MLKSLVAEFVERRGLLLRIVPPVFAEDLHAGEVLEALQECGFKRDASVASYRTIRVDLRPEPALIRRQFDGKWRNQLNAAERNGLTVTEGASDELYATFLGLYDETMARKRFDTTVDPRRFRRIQQRLTDSEKMRITICLKAGVPQSALVATGVGETGVYLLGGTSDDGLKSKGSYLLQWRTMNRLREQGCRWYDLGGINPETNPGVYHFKQGMGGQECRQLGRYELRGSRVSAVAVNAAERVRSVIAKIRG